MSGKYEVNPDADAPKRSKKQGKIQSFLTYLYNREDGTCFERTPLSWAKITTFYIIYYALLAGLWTAMLMGFFVTIDDNQPRHQDYDSLIKYNPGMGYRPQPNSEYTLIEFNQGEEDSYKVYTDNLDKFLYKYADENQTAAGAIDCDPADPNQDYRDPNLACKYPLSRLGTECVSEKHYGYDVGRPCVLLKMNKIFNWEPEPMSNDSIPDDLKDRYKPGYVGVTCEGRSDADRDNMGPVVFYPAAGFDASYFPYKNQKGYVPPIVMAQFTRLRLGTLVIVNCKIWAKNIYHDMNDRAGSVHFELLMD